jgi:hypothetical protein
VTPFTWSAAWLVAHLLLYLGGLKRSHRLRTEPSILFYHVASFVLVGGSGLLAWWRAGGGTGESLAEFVAAISLHGIYSMSFLALWSSAQGGYSFHMMKALHAGSRERTDFVEQFVRTGDDKRENRLASLAGAGLLVEHQGHYHVTPRGRWLAWLLRTLYFLHNTRQAG